MIEEIRQQPEGLARGIGSVRKFKKLVEKQRPKFIVLVARGRWTTPRCSDATAGDRHRYSSFAGGAFDASRGGDRFQSSKDCPDSCLTRSVRQQVAG
jgi:hypothetical protein